jgi:Na+/phosphate symporter
MDTLHAPVVEDGERAELVGMADRIVQMLRDVRDAFSHLDPGQVERALQLGRLVLEQEQGVLERLARRSAEARLAGQPVEEDVVFVPMHLERIAECVGRLGESTVKVVREGTLFTDRAVHEVSGLVAQVIEMLESVRDALRTSNPVLVRYVVEAGRSCEARVGEYARFHEKRLIEGVCQPRASSIYLMMLDDIRGIEWHARQIAQKIERMAPQAAASPGGRAGHPAGR